MINRFRRKLLLVTMSAVLLVMALIFMATSTMNYIYITSNADNMLTLIAENNGVVPAQLPNKPDKSVITQESQYQTRYFIVQFNKYNTIIDINTSHIAAINSETATKYALSVLANNTENGYMDVYRYKVSSTDFGQIVIFLDCTLQLKTLNSMVATFGAIALVSSLLIFFVIFLFSKRFIRPMIDNIEKQKRFITDAGHELKTPLAIINANVEVMEMINGTNEWTDSIKHQVSRLDKLVKSMLHLAKMEENTLTPVFIDFDLSRAFIEITEPFEIMAQQKGLTLSIRAQENIHLYGDESAIRNLISILVDNAIKYSTDNGTIDAILRRDGNAIKIKIRNSAASSNHDDLNKLFDRFYRPDSARSRESGGFGIGLSMARTIVESHKGKINAQRETGGYVSFNVTLRSTQSKKKI